MRVLLGSGNGTNAKSILETQNNFLMLGNAKIVGIFSNVPSSGIIDVAEEYYCHTD